MTKNKKDFMKKTEEGIYNAIKDPKLSKLIINLIENAYDLGHKHSLEEQETPTSPESGTSVHE